MATRLGLTMRSINDDEDATIVMGVNVRAVQVVAFTIGGAFTGLSGALYALNFGFVEAQYFNSLLSIYVLLVRADRRRADGVGTACRKPVLHAVAGAVPCRRLLALSHLRRRDRG